MIEEAKSIVNKLEFEGGNPDPKGEIEEYQNLTPDDGYAQTAQRVIQLIAPQRSRHL